MTEGDGKFPSSFNLRLVLLHGALFCFTIRRKQSKKEEV